MSNLNNLSGPAKISPTTQKSYKWDEISEIAKHEKTLEMADTAAPELAQYYKLGEYFNKTGRENWVARWYLWRSFRNNRVEVGGANPSIKSLAVNDDPLMAASLRTAADMGGFEPDDTTTQMRNETAPLSHYQASMVENPSFFADPLQSASGLQEFGYSQVPVVGAEASCNQYWPAISSEYKQAGSAIELDLPIRSNFGLQRLTNFIAVQFSCSEKA